MDTAFDKSRELIKEATANKTKDINEAISIFVLRLQENYAKA